MAEAQIIALIVAITELSKEYIPSKYSHLVAVVIGIAFGYYSNPTVEGAIYGLAIGLGTTGVYRAAGKFIGKK